MNEFVQVLEDVLTGNLIELGCKYSNFGIVLSVFPSVLFLGEDSLKVEVLFLQVSELVLDVFHLLDGSFVEMRFHFRFKINTFAFIILEFELSSVNGLFCVHDLFSKLFCPFGQQSQDGRI